MASFSCAFSGAARCERPRCARAATSAIDQPGRFGQGPEEKEGCAGDTCGFGGRAELMDCLHVGASVAERRPSRPSGARAHRPYPRPGRAGQSTIVVNRPRIVAATARGAKLREPHMPNLMPNLTPPIRRAVADDARALADLVNFAGEGMPLHLWRGLAEPGASEAEIWEIGRARQAAKVETDEIYVVDEGQGAIAGLTGYAIGARRRGSSRPRPRRLRPAAPAQRNRSAGRRGTAAGPRPGRRRAATPRRPGGPRSGRHRGRRGRRRGSAAGPWSSRRRGAAGSSGSQCS